MVVTVAALPSAAKSRLAPILVARLLAETHVPAIQAVLLLAERATVVQRLVIQVVLLLAEAMVVQRLAIQVVPLLAATVVQTTAPRLANQAVAVM